MRWVQVFKSIEQARAAIEDGKARRIVIGEKRIALTRQGDEFHAIQDECPHSKAYLSQGWLNNMGQIVCPLHNYCYDLKNGREHEERSIDAKIWNIKCNEEGLFIELE